MLVEETETKIDEMDQVVYISLSLSLYELLDNASERKPMKEWLIYLQEEVEMEDIEPVIDIDAPDANNPFAVVEYVEELYAFHRTMEVVALPLLLAC